VRELTLAEVKGSPRAKIDPVKRFRDSHHRMAMLFASGLRVRDVAELTGYSLSRVSVMHNNPAFQALIVEYRDIEKEAYKDAVTEMNRLILSNGMKAERKLADKLDDDDENEELSVRELISIARDAADRIGLSKRTIQTNVDVDFAAVLDKALSRSATVRSGDAKLIEARPVPDLAPPAAEAMKVVEDIVRPMVVKFKRRF